MTALLDWRSVRPRRPHGRATHQPSRDLLSSWGWRGRSSWEGRAADSPPLLPVVVALDAEPHRRRRALHRDVGAVHGSGWGAFLLAHVAYVWAILADARGAGIPLARAAGRGPLGVLHFGRSAKPSCGMPAPIKVAVLFYQLALLVLVVAAACAR